MALGVTFAPGSQDQMPQRPQQGIQEAIKLLSLRLPQVVGANSPVPAPLLQSPGGMGAPDATGNPLLDLLRKLLGGMQPNMMGLPGPPQGPGRTGGGIPNPMPGPLPLPTQHPPTPKVILQNPPTPQKPQMPYPEPPRPAPPDQQYPFPEM